ncbi:MAG: hypothetical protein KC731_35640, partial [Myxococcales bacterium]|nr:hypothetical protein [Myxococcales bacterium]
SVDIQRALRASRRGDFEAVRAAATRALERPETAGTQSVVRVQRSAALALRAFAAASLGDPEATRRDVDAVRAEALAEPEACARAELALAVALHKAGERDALRQHLAAADELLDEHSAPRDRALLRSLHRMLRAPAPSIYRKPASPSDEPLAVTDWVGRVVPEAGPFARDIEASPPPRPPLPATAHPAEADAAKRGPAVTLQRGARLAGLAAAWLVVVGVTVLLFRLGDGAPRGFRPGTAAEGGLFLAAVVVTWVGYTVYRIRRATQGERDARAARTRLCREGAAAVLPALERLADGSSVYVAAYARQILALHAFREGHFDEALRHAEAGLAQLASEAQRRFAHDELLPTLASQRALALAALGRASQASEALGSLNARYHHFAHLDGVNLQIAALGAARDGDLATLQALSAARGELPVGPRVELLLDLGQAAGDAAGVGAAEIARLRGVLARESAALGWVRAIAPDLVRAFEQAVALPEPTA